VPSSDDLASSEAIRPQSAVEEEDREMQNSAERWVSHHTTAASVVCPSQSAPEVIQLARNWYSLIGSIESTNDCRPAVVKNNCSLNLSNTLHRGSLPDNPKVREYIVVLH